MDRIRERRIEKKGWNLNLKQKEKKRSDGEKRKQKEQNGYNGRKVKGRDIPVRNVNGKPVVKMDDLG